MSLPIRVLVVDDSPFMRRALVRMIEQDVRFKVIDTAEDGQDGVTKALRIKPDLVTLDVDMPIMNGIDALRAIVAQSNIPVVMVSAQTHKGAKVTLEALEIGAVDVIPKSDGVDLLHEKLGAAVSAKLGRRNGAFPKTALKAPAPVAPLKQATPGRLRNKPRLVLIGSSTGGPQALQEVIQHLPKDLSVPVVIAQHMPPQFTQALAERLDEKCPPIVEEAKDGITLARGHIYIAPGGMQLRVTADKLKVSPDRGESLYKPSVDVLAESALAAFGGHVLGVMLTGMGSDGAKEFLRLKQAGAYIIAQDQASCVVYGMPRAVAEQNGADEILPLEQIGQRLSALLLG